MFDFLEAMRAGQRFEHDGVKYIRISGTCLAWKDDMRELVLAVEAHGNVPSPVVLVPMPKKAVETKEKGDERVPEA